MIALLLHPGDPLMIVLSLRTGDPLIVALSLVKGYAAAYESDCNEMLYINAI